MIPNATETAANPAIHAGQARIPAGQRIYAIGDIHGRLDLLEALATAIETDDAASPAQSTVLLLGDLIDRGRDSAGVIDYVLGWQERRPVRVLMGNHEEVFLAAFTDTEYLRRLLPYGARETLISYGIDAHVTGPDALQRMQAAMAARIPRHHREFMAALELSAVIGDYLFVHAGIEPGIPVAEQSAQAMRWIRDPFLMHEGLFEKVVVHGHTIRTEVEERPNRIGIDTGAYCYGLLTALVLEGGERRFIQAREQDGAITTLHRDAV